MRRAPIGAWLVLWLALALPLDAELPFRTERASLLPRGELSLDLGIGLREQPRDFGIPDRDRQWNLGIGRFRLSLGKLAEVQLSGVLLMAMETAGQRQQNWGDWTLGTKIRVLSEKGDRPALGLLWEVKLPLGSNEKGGATDETDFFAHVLISKRLGKRSALHGNLGIGVLGHPETLAAQNDVLILRLAYEHRLAARGILGLEGLLRSGPNETDDARSLRLLGSVPVGLWQLYGAVGLGFGDDSDELEVEVGFQRRFQLLKGD